MTNNLLNNIINLAIRLSDSALTYRKSHLYHFYLKKRVAQPVDQFCLLLVRQRTSQAFYLAINTNNNHTENFKIISPSVNLILLTWQVPAQGIKEQPSQTFLYSSYWCVCVAYNTVHNILFTPTYFSLLLVYVNTTVQAFLFSPLHSRFYPAYLQSTWEIQFVEDFVLLSDAQRTVVFRVKSHGFG